MHDVELTRLPQPPAADRSDIDDGEAEREEEAGRLEPQAPLPASGRGSRTAKGARVREGLPSGYRMRHAPHYVEQLMGGAPIQTVRHIATEQLEPLHASDAGAPAGDAVRALDGHDGRVAAEACSSAHGDAVLAALAASIRRVGLLQPILVAQTGPARFGIVAGERRWRAARAAGLRTVPCLLVHTEAAKAQELRAQAGVRSAAAVELPIERPARAADQDSVPAQAAVALTELHRAVMADLAAVTAGQAATRAAAAALLGGGEQGETHDRNAPHEPAVLRWADLIDGLRRDAATEARLRGVAFEWPEADRLRDATADPDAIRTAWAAVLQAALAASASGDRMVVTLATPRVRPAIVFSVALDDGAGAAGERSAADVRFDATSEKVLLAAARKAAQMHGGRLTVTPREAGVTIDFVVPQFFAAWD